MKKAPVIIFLTLFLNLALAEVKSVPCNADSECALYKDHCGKLLAVLKSSVLEGKVSTGSKGGKPVEPCLEINIIDSQRNRPKNPIAKCVQHICTVAAGHEARKNITDYYGEIPDQFLTMRADSDGHYLSKEERLSVISTNDEKNGYISVKSEKLSSEFTIVLFKTKAKKDMIGIVEDGASVQQPIRFITLEDGMWVDVTAKVFPEVSKDYIFKRYQAVKPYGKTYSKKDLDQATHSLVRYALPREGKIVEVYAGIEDDGVGKKVLFTLSFDGNKFNLKP